MKIKIDDIKIGARIRKEPGDLTTLKNSIQEIGLINPILINMKNELLSGYRRLHACRQLGWTEIEVKIINTGEDAVKKLDLEYHENLGRLDLTQEEKITYNHTRNELLNPPKPKFKFWDWLKKIWQAIQNLFTRKH